MFGIPGSLHRIQADKARLEVGLEFEPEFGGNHHFSAEGSQCFANEFFIYIGTVDFGSVEECDAAFDCCLAYSRVSSMVMHRSCAA